MHFPQSPKVIILMFFGLCGRVDDSQNQLFIIWDTPNYFKWFKKSPRIIFGEYYSGYSHTQRKSNFCFRGKDGGRPILQILLMNSWKYWIWHQYLSTSWTVLSNLWNFEILKCETMKIMDIKALNWHKKTKLLQIMKIVWLGVSGELRVEFSQAWNGVEPSWPALLLRLGPIPSFCLPNG